MKIEFHYRRNSAVVIISAIISCIITFYNTKNIINNSSGVTFKYLFIIIFFIIFSIIIWGVLWSTITINMLFFEIFSKEIMNFEKEFKLFNSVQDVRLSEHTIDSISNYSYIRLKNELLVGLYSISRIRQNLKMLTTDQLVTIRFNLIDVNMVNSAITKVLGLLIIASTGGFVAGINFFKSVFPNIQQIFSLLFLWIIILLVQYLYLSFPFENARNKFLYLVDAEIQNRKS